MGTFGELKDKIAAETRRTNLSTEIGDAVKSAIKRYEGLRLPFNEARASFTTVANQEVYTVADGIPSDIIEINQALIRFNGADYPLRRISQEEINVIRFGDTPWIGQPYSYSYYGEAIWFYPAPNSTYTVTFFCQKKLPEFTSDDDSNGWTTDGFDLIKMRAKWDIYYNILNDFEKAALMDAEAERQKTILEARATKRLATNKLRSRY